MQWWILNLDVIELKSLISVIMPVIVVCLVLGLVSRIPDQDDYD